MRYSNEIRVGIVFLGGLALMIFGYFYLRGLGLNAESYTLRLNGAASIAQGNEVRLQGVKIGQVSDVNFDPATQQPILKIAVRRADPSFKLLKSYDYSVQSAGLVGENYVDIRGDYNTNADIYNPDDPSEIIPAEASSGILAAANSASDLAKNLEVTIAKVNTTLDAVNNGLLNNPNQRRLAEALDSVAKLTTSASKTFDESTGRQLQRTLANGERASANIERATRDAGGLSRDVQGLVRNANGQLVRTSDNFNSIANENRGELKKLLANTTRASNSVAGLTETLDFTLRAGNFPENSQAALKSLRVVADNIAVATTGLRKLSDDPTTTTDLKRTLVALRESTESLSATAASLQGFVAGDGTGQLKGVLASLGTISSNLEVTTTSLNNIIGDPAVQADIKGSADNLNNTLAATRASAERINALLGGKKRTQTDAGTGAGATETAATNSFGSPGASLILRSLSETPRGASGRNFGDARFDADLLGGPFRIGLDNIGDGDDFTLQSGKYLSPNLAARYGLYRSELGVGLEARKGKFFVEGNAYGLNDSSYNLYGGLAITRNLELMAGTESIRGNGTASIAVRLRP